ncbi:MAG TPA: DedA family protein [Acetobacteraceae bacterium]|jgi:membrane protein DedA with SNARE-associated domain|nr:DedA family protein [Acetobacteraceae bacterium]
MNAPNAGLLAGFIISVLQASGYLGVLGLMAIESACLPLPSEIILPFAGYLVSTGRLNLYLVATVGALGCNLGSLVAYEVGAHGGRPAVRRWGKYVLLTDDDLAKADWFFHRFGGPAVLIARMLPVIRTFIALPAGIAHMRRVRFHLYTFIGSWPWCFLLAWVGMKLGDAWGSNGNLHTVFHYFDYVIIAAAALVIGRFVWSRRRRAA